jgi:hypothetical protein
MSRRSLVQATGLAGLLTAAGALDGCDLDLRSSSPAATPPEPDADQVIVESARAELGGLIARLSATPGHEPLLACHRAQLGALAGHPPAPTRRARPFSHAQLVAREQRAAARFTHWASSCGNGELARVLASIAAGIGMQPVLRSSYRSPHRSTGTAAS